MDTMIDINREYPVGDWRDALEAAEEWEFCPIDTKENTPGITGLLGAWISDELHGHDVAGPEGQEITPTVTAPMLHAAIQVIDDDRSSLSAATLSTVLRSYRGETGNDFTELARQYAEDDYDGPDNPADTGWDGFDSEDAYEIWYTANGIPEGERCADGGDDTLYWFDRHSLKYGW
jgi:hypothetical protein